MWIRTSLGKSEPSSHPNTLITGPQCTFVMSKLQAFVLNSIGVWFEKSWHVVHLLYALTANLFSYYREITLRKATVGNYILASFTS
jgi:hypothetical protein